MATTTTEIAKTMIGTPTSINGLTLCKGVALIPPIPDIPVGFQTNPSKQVSADHNFSKYHAIRAYASAGVGVVAGLCGPGYAVGFTAEGTVEDDLLTLTIDDDEAMAGMFCGIGGSFELSMGIAYYRITHLSWRNGPSIELNIGLDFLKTAVDLIAAVLQVEDLLATAAVTLVTEAAGTPLAMVGESSDNYATNNGVLRLDCIFSIPINLWAVIVVASLAGEVVPGLDVATSVVLAAHEFMDCTLSSVGFGPTIGVDIPVLLQIDDVTIDTVKFDKTSVTGGTWIGKKSNPDDVLAAAPQDISFNMGHNCSFDFVVGLFVEVQVAEFFHVGAGDDIEVMGLFGFKKFAGTVHHSLKNVIGGLMATDCTDCVATGAGEGIFDVQFI